MANVPEDLCDSSPAKRARLEFTPFNLQSEEQFVTGNDPFTPNCAQRGAMAIPDPVNSASHVMVFPAPTGMAMVSTASSADDLGRGKIDPGLSANAMHQTGDHGGEMVGSSCNSAYTAGVSSTSENVNELDHGCDSGFNELLPSALDSTTDHPAEQSNNDVKNFDLLCSTEPDSSMTSCIIDSFNDVPLDIDDKDDVASTISHLSGLSDLSDVSGQDWKPIAGPISWVQRQMQTGANPRELLQELVPIGTHIPDHLDDTMLWKIVVNMLSEPPCRKKLSQVNTLEDVVQLLRVSKRVIVLTGAGVSVSCGIPDFRSRDGVYARLAKDFPDLPDPQAMFDIHYFRKDPRPFFKFAREIYPGQFKPSPSHRFIKRLEDHKKLLRNYSQNIDTLEQIAGIESVIQCHGSFATATCTRCGHKVDASAIKDDVFQQKIPACPVCLSDSEELAVMKPDIVFFGEGLPEEFHSTMARDKDDCDLLIVIGSSLKVRPVALIPNSIPGHIPQVLINREPLRHLNFDVELLGDCDGIINELCLRLGDGWNDICFTGSLREIGELPPRLSAEDQRAATASSSLPSTSLQPSHSNTPDVAVESASRGVSAIQCRDVDPCDSTSMVEGSRTDMDLPSTAALKPPPVPDSTKSDEVDPTSENDIEALRACWKPKLKENLADRLPAGTYLYSPSNRYIFSGAEVLRDTELDSLPGSGMDSDSDSDDTTSTSSGDTAPDNEANAAEAEDGQTGSGDDSGVGDMRDTVLSSTDITAAGDTVSEMTHLNWSSTKVEFWEDNVVKSSSSTTTT